MALQIEIKNWEKFNPKRDQKTYTWLRLDQGIGTDPDLFGLTAEQKFVWVMILCEASKKNTGRVSLNLEWLADTAKVKITVIEKLLEFLEQKSTISILRPCAAVSDRELPPTTPTDERTNETDERTVLPDSASAEPRRVLDFESLYRKYPRKEGKTKGLQACKAQIKSPEEYRALSFAIDRYSAHVKRQGTELKFVKHFSSFMSCWRDWIEPEPADPPGPPKPPTPTPSIPLNPNAAEDARRFVAVIRGRTPGPEDAA